MFKFLVKFGKIMIIACLIGVAFRVIEVTTKKDYNIAQINQNETIAEEVNINDTETEMEDISVSNNIEEKQIENVENKSEEKENSQISNSDNNKTTKNETKDNKVEKKTETIKTANKQEQQKEQETTKQEVAENNKETIKSATVKTAETTSYTEVNQWKQGYIKVVKKDAETGEVVKQAGVVFDIYNSNNQKVTSITTNSNGVATSTLLDYGTYYVKENKAPNKYTVQVEVSENIGVIENEKTYEISILNTRVKGSVSISKEDNETGKVAQGEATLEGAVYGLYAREDILNPADNSVLYKANAKIAELTTDENANASIENLYLGKYFLKEIKASDGYTLDTTEYDFELTYESQNKEIVTKSVEVKERVISQAFQIIKISSDETGDSVEPQTWRIFNDKSFNSVLQIVKQDAETDKNVLVKGATFKIKNLDTGKYFGYWEWSPFPHYVNTWTTDETGKIMTGDVLEIGNYQLEEIKSPYGYLISDKPVTFRISSNTAYETLPDNKTPVITVVQKDISVKGQINVEKKGFVETQIKRVFGVFHSEYPLFFCHFFVEIYKKY